jgi:hypothetical protein
MNAQLIGMNAANYPEGERTRYIRSMTVLCGFMNGNRLSELQEIADTAMLVMVDHLAADRDIRLVAIANKILATWRP